MFTLYGIPNCDTVKKARKWLENNAVEYQFHDFRKDGLDTSTVESWISALSWEQVVNKRSTSWRALSDETKANMDNATAVAEIIKQPTLIKRPVLVGDNTLQLGFKESDYQQLT